MKSNRKNNLRCVVSSTALVLGMVGNALAFPQAAYAQSAATQHFNIAAGDLAADLQSFSAETGIQLIYSSNLVAGKRSPGVSGDMSVAQALQQLLGGTGLMARVSGNSATIVSIDDVVSPSNGERVLGAVRVEGVQSSPYFGGAGQAAGVNGINGSQDITATEGTGSFTSGALTIGSKAPQAMKDVPQSVSVLTSERMQQQNVTDFTDAMKQLPGVTVVQGTTSLENTFYSRGFAITSIQVDGGAPLTTNYYFSPQIDMSVYDHVELLRGAAGQFNFYGDPGGTVNLVRKKPLDHAQFSLEAQAGSWSNYRIVADATSPLALDGRLRGRLVMTYQDNHYFYDTAKDNKTLIYGITEFDATPTTLLTAGISYTRQHSVPWLGGLPRYQTGEDLKLPRSTCLCFGWNRWDFDTAEIFGGGEQKIGDDWTAKINLTWNRQQSTRKVGYSDGSVNPLTNAGPQLYSLYTDFDSKQLSAEAVVNGAFMLFGQRQEVTIGANRTSSHAVLTGHTPPITSSPSSPYQPYPGGPLYCTDVSICPSGTDTPPIDVFDFNPNDPIYVEPRGTLTSYRTPGFGQTQSGAYINLRLTAFDRLHFTTGLRWSRYAVQFNYEYLCTSTMYSCSDKQIGDVYYTYGESYGDDHISWPPSANLSFDVTKQLTAYLGYTDIYQSQANYLTADHKPLSPITGSNWEAGLKWSARDGKLNLSLSAYKIKQRGFGVVDPPDYSTYTEVSPGVYCCFIAFPNAAYLSRGFDAEATGEILPGWQISASYTYNDNKQKGDYYFGASAGTPVRSIQPKNLYKLWMSYDFGARSRKGWLSGLSVSGGINGQSSAYYAGSVCRKEYIITNPVTGAYQGCETGGNEDFSFTVPPYAVVSARIDYRLSDRWSLALNLDNLLDKTYYQTVGSSPTSGSWYGAPRSFIATLRAKW